MTDRFYLIQLVSDGFGGPPEAHLRGPYDTQNAQVLAAREVRDEAFGLEFVLWLDIEDGTPKVGAFDPQFYTEAK
jgi:hypothetical protein